MKNKKYFIPINGKLYETSQEIYKAYYKMDRRERYLQELSEKHELSYDALKDAEYPIEEKIENIKQNVEDEATNALMVEKMLSAMYVLTEYENWLVKEIYFKSISERQIEKEYGIPRKTLSYQRERILEKLKVMLNK